MKIRRIKEDGALKRYACTDGLIPPFMRNGVANNENSTQKQEERRPIKGKKNEKNPSKLIKRVHSTNPHSTGIVWTIF
jgi:hypothetical protein